MHIYKYSVLLILLITNFVANGQIKIFGHIQLDSTWRNEVYASYIPSPNDFYKCSDSLIISKATIDAYGNWELDIPQKSYQHFIRIHVSKRSYPEASLIIGGRENNHGFLALGENKALNYQNAGAQLFSDFSTVEDPLNAQMAFIKQLALKWEEEYQNSKNQNEKKIIREQSAEALINYADTVSEILPAIYAVHLADMGFNKVEVHDAMLELKNKHGEHPYFNDFTLPDSELGLIELLTSIFILLLVIYLTYRIITLRRGHKRRRLFESLSNREVDVYNLTIASKSNQEIADILNVEISTVKSHLHSIYGKLNVNSRNQLKNFIPYNLNAAT